MLFAKVPHFLAEELPKDRPFTRLEAWFQYDMDTYISKARSEREYSRMWSWGRDKVARFINEIRNEAGAETSPFFSKNDQPNTSQRPAKHQPPKPLENGMLELATSQTPANDPPNTNQLFIRENKKEQHSVLYDLWNEVVKGTPLPAARNLSEDRLKKCNTRLKERSLQEWEKVFRLMTASTFMCGGGNKGWTPNFDWIIANADRAESVLEGKYKNADGRAGDNDKRYAAIFAGA